MGYMDRTNGSVPRSGRISRSDMLQHIADMAGELKKHAREMDAAVLASILDLARVEAIVEAERGRQAPLKG